MILTPDIQNCSIVKVKYLQDIEFFSVVNQQQIIEYKCEFQNTLEH